MSEYRKRPVLAAASFAAGVALLMACNAEDTTGADLLERAAKECGPDTPDLRIADDGRTLLVDHKGEEDTYGVTLDQLACVIWLLEPPSAVTGRMDSTRALDGMQEASWAEYAMSWSYHPNTGLDVIVTTD